MDHTSTRPAHSHGHPYRTLLVMAILSFIAMTFLMYAMVDTFGNVYLNYNQWYMAGLMTGPMVLIELTLMRKMYPKAIWNAAIATIAIIGMLMRWSFIRQQTAITDKQFLQSMIPHHAGALLMCREATLTDPELKQLCESIHKSQQKEI